MEIARTPEIQPDGDRGKRWPAGRRKGTAPPRKPRPADAPPEEVAAEGEAVVPPPEPPAHRVDVTV
jgi:hypothetical protein